MLNHSRAGGRLGRLIEDVPTKTGFDRDEQRHALALRLDVAAGRCAAMMSGAAPEVPRAAVEFCRNAEESLLAPLASMFDGVTGCDDESTDQELSGGGCGCSFGKA